LRIAVASASIRCAVALVAFACTSAAHDARAQGIGAADAPAQSILNTRTPPVEVANGTANAAEAANAEEATDPAGDAPVDTLQRFRIESACAQARRADWGHIALGATMAVVGALGYLPNALDTDSQRPPITAFGGGLGLGLVGGGLILTLRPYSAGAMRLVLTCEALAGSRRGNPRTLRAAQRYLNAVADAQRDWALRAGLVAAGVTLVGVTLSALLVPAPRDKYFWSGVFLAVPLAFWFDLLAPSPAIQASLRFRRGGFALHAIGPTIYADGGGGVSIGGAF
jgi:hypothetical protein